MEVNKETSLSALVVDDNEVNALILMKMLKIFNIFTAQTYSGKNAIRLCRKNNYDIVFVDHIMPEMNGLEVTSCIRKIKKSEYKPVIFIITSMVSDKIRTLYSEAGANEVFEKPLTLTKLITYLKKWFPMVSKDVTCNVKKTASLYANELLQLRKIVENIREINFNSTIKYSFGNPDYFINILTASIKDIQNFLDLKSLKMDNPSMNGYSEIKTGIHNLKNVFANIGANERLEEAKCIETVINRGDAENMDLQLYSFINHTADFKNKLETAVNEYEKLKQTDKSGQDKNIYRMQYTEYEQCINNAIYYIKRFEFDSMISEIEKLISYDTEYKTEFEKALEEAKKFNYDKALIKLTRIIEQNRMVK